ncbi:MAG: hypothetical protein BWY60_00228 [Actinobacteria bacterium ADurb.Bin346]|nr:MAG: hypothetical protein BWY60_00228 [Actinobacteria bacterium ADurb.Bin346]
MHLICLTASITSPVPASPFVLVIAAPSPILLKASPRFVAPQTNGTLKSHLFTWCLSSAGVRTSLSSIKSTPIDSSICASAKWPIRHFAITGIETASIIFMIISGSAILATPPAALMSAGTLSSAMTETAPASSATLACSTVVTSIITPPLSISARPVLTFNVPFSILIITLHL